MTATTRDEAADLAEARGCIEYLNPCWPECVESAAYFIEGGDLEPWERVAIGQHDADDGETITRGTE